MLCEKCKNIEKTHEIDRYGNILIRWTCTAHYYNVYSQVIYDPFFWNRLKSGRFHKDEVDFSSMIPSDKALSELQRIEVIFQRNVEDCKDYREMTEGLERFI